MDNAKSWLTVGGVFLTGFLLGWTTYPRAASQPARVSPGPEKEPENRPLLAARLSELFEAAAAAGQACRPFETGLEQGGDWQREHLYAAQDAALPRIVAFVAFARELADRFPQEPATGALAGLAEDYHSKQRGKWNGLRAVAEYVRYQSRSDLSMPGPAQNGYRGVIWDSNDKSSEALKSEQAVRGAVTAFRARAQSPVRPGSG